MNFMMIGIELRSDLAGEWSFIELLIVEGRTKRTESSCRQKFSHCTGDGGGIDPPRKKRADWNITAQANAHRLSHALADAFHRLV